MNRKDKKSKLEKVYVLLKKRLREEEVLKFAEASEELLHSKLKLENIDTDPVGLSIYFKLLSVTTSQEFLKLHE